MVSNEPELSAVTLDLLGVQRKKQPATEANHSKRTSISQPQINSQDSDRVYTHESPETKPAYKSIKAAYHIPRKRKEKTFIATDIMSESGVSSNRSNLSSKKRNMSSYINTNAAAQ